MSSSRPGNADGEIAIEVRSVSKSYRLGSNTSLYDTLAALGPAIARMAKHSLGIAPASRETFMALRDVSFSVNHGEIVGLVGNNGAGKSTLLKIISRITPPTSGSIRISGRVGSLLDVGTGFHPDLSGRDNIFLNGAILGMSRHDIVRHFDEIVDFAGVESFIDTPVKRYSSGMYMRLAFAVAAHLDSEILLVDEVLAVGDVNFQNKCMDRMSSISKSGRTILFVSHNLSAVQSMCHRVVWFDRGHIAADGPPHKVLDAYLKNAAGEEGQAHRFWPDKDQAPGDESFSVRRCAVIPEGGVAGDPVSIGSPFDIEIEYWNGTPDADLNVTWLIHNSEGIMLFNAGNWKISPRRRVGYYVERCRVPADFMNDGTYFLTLEIIKSGAVFKQFPRILRCELLDSDNGRNGWYGEWHGAMRPRLAWDVEERGDDVSREADRHHERS
ncbi:Teichoic acids export ATP-binding protein TagH [Hartmannibacter diazotrophicus]|uniref:Teichoic acids export ATP-binding protein TagH n=1 Tax=Hartmannibacter diazotrophicus TaxID=1482074 RepID=A0A2C9D0R2_9HYPH|nr:ABC transporter ATP-binding protein [Hartmannibacter diazotrophicus]SON53912.1 Teichoic acids export ATP-binding protein TagH [Hartmannibacter diazotrophicus]